MSSRELAETQNPLCKHKRRLPSLVQISCAKRGFFWLESLCDLVREDFYQKSSSEALASIAHVCAEQNNVSGVWLELKSPTLAEISTVSVRELVEEPNIDTPELTNMFIVQGCLEVYSGTIKIGISYKELTCSLRIPNTKN